ncbi:hypothetical protein SAMN04488544_1157 [Microlunatus sagamiharensis]|uniref:DUF5129 domain-containing protein n=1 Tax=Microlunatus sagamiharensis TaxID=546874 RepID=A0A1H2M016_9ACTN|nr:DUF5129 domain-containing protein [Microlunatus sagamiharensis]SDU86484.1 hypothetical protein SAMN04488544_1157 [Microlunatus sagamiharensis]
MVMRHGVVRAGGATRAVRVVRAAGAVTAAVLVLVVPAGNALAAAPTTRASLVLDDGRILDDRQVVKDINALRNRTGVEVAVLTTEGDADVHKDTYDDDVLTYLQEHDDQIVLDGGGDGLRDGLILLAVSPGVRQVGVYAGDDVDLDADGVEEVVDAVRADARAGRWEEVAVGGARKALAVTAEASSSGSDEPGTSDDQDPYPTYPEEDPTSAGSGSSLLAGRVLGAITGLAALLGIPFAVAALRRRRRRRAELLAWTPEPAVVAAALRQWRDAIEQVQMTGYPDPPRDRSGRAAWTYDPDGSITALETLAASGPTLAQRVDPVEHARITALLAPRATLTAWVDDARFWAREDGWEQRWAAELDRLVDAPLAAFLGSVDDLESDRPSRRLARVRTEAEAFRSGAVSLDASVRASVVRPTAGVREAQALNTEIRRFAQEAALTVVRGMSDWSKHRLVAGSGGHDPSMAPYLLSSLIASSSDRRGASEGMAGVFGAGGFGTGFGTGGSDASTTFNDSSSSGGGMTGGSGGY